jgi:hypothetical protein
MSYESQIKKLLSNKESMGGEKYAAAIGKLKKEMKADGASFSKTLNSVKKQEREGNFDRGAEGKAKNKLRKKMAKGMESVATRGRHEGSIQDKKLKSYAKAIDKGRVGDGVGGKATQVDVAKAATGETDAQRKARKNKMTKAKIAKSR